MGLHAEAPHQVADGAARCHLSEDHGAVVVIYLGDGCAVPEALRLELAAEIQVVGILAAQNLRPAAGELHPHARVVITGTGKYEGNLALTAKGRSRVKQPVKEGGVSQDLVRVLASCQQLYAMVDECYQFFPVAGNQGQGAGGVFRSIGAAVPLSGQGGQVIALRLV